ncbi:MAG: response regulator transcription factor [Acidobacteriota bacterium]
MYGKPGCDGETSEGKRIELIRTYLFVAETLMREGLGLILRSAPDISVAGASSNKDTVLREVAELRPDVVIIDVKPLDEERPWVAHEIPIRSPGAGVILLLPAGSNSPGELWRSTGTHAHLCRESTIEEVIETVRATRRVSRTSGSPTRPEPQHLQPESDSLEILSPRELQVFGLVVDGLTSKEIAHATSLSPKSVDTYRFRLMKKLGVRDLPSLVKLAIRWGVTSASA